MTEAKKNPRLTYRTIWVSDVHLGSKSARADYLVDFLKSTECEKLYLVGDIIDFWSMRKTTFWPQSHNDVIREILRKSKQGTQVIYIPGNHDMLLRDHAGLVFGNISIQLQDIHETKTGQRLLVTHGDEFDQIVTCNRLKSFFGNHAYDFLIWLNRVVNRVRKRFDMPYWSLATYLKHKSKNAIEYIHRFEQAVAYEVEKKDVDGLVCGHLHRAEMETINGVLYCNDGDWVESCTALVEKDDGMLQLIHWADDKHALKKIDVETLSKVSKAA